MQLMINREALKALRRVVPATLQDVLLKFAAVIRMMRDSPLQEMGASSSSNATVPRRRGNLDHDPGRYMRCAVA
jgi:hypothetical protein